MSGRGTRKYHCIAAAGALLVFWLFNRMAEQYRIAPGQAVEKLEKATELKVIFRHPFQLSFFGSDLLWGLLAAAVIAGIYIYFFTARRPRMPGKEYGSAEWGNEETIKPLIDANPDNNIILTETERLSMSGRMPRTSEDDFNRNKNVLIIGGSGSGKTRFYVKPNLLQMNCNYVVTDPKGALLQECGHALAANGYKIKVFDLKNRENSERYNMLAYVHNEDDIVKLAKNIITNLKPDPRVQSSGDPIWEEGMTGLLEALISFVMTELPEKERNMVSVMELFRLLSIQVEDGKEICPLDNVFNDLKKRKPDSFALKQYEIYKMASPKTAQSINVSLGLRLNSFNIPSVARIVADDDLNLDELGTDEKVALFIILPDTTRAYNFLAAVMYQQLFDILVMKADTSGSFRLPRHVRFILDEFANLGQIPDFEVLIATIRQREISVNIILQSLSQLESLYKNDWRTIVDNCDTFLYLGGVASTDSLEFVSKRLGKGTIETTNITEQHSGQGGMSKSLQLIGRELMLPDEISRMKRRYCILIITGLPPFFSRKYNLEKHPRYALLEDADKNNRFDPARDGALAFFSNVKGVMDIEMDFSELHCA